MEPAEVPLELGRNMVACGCCKLVKSHKQFEEQGCENCPFLDMAGDRSRVRECTTQSFSGLIVIAEPATSWAAKWVHLEKKAPGCYALSVDIEFPDQIIEILEDNNIPIPSAH